MMKNKGFTLIEVLIASFVIVVGVVASYIIVQQIFAQTFRASARLTAIYLAKEGAEVVRNIRDTGWIQSDSWYNNGLDVGYWQVEYDSNNLLICILCNGSDYDFDRFWGISMWFLKSHTSGDPFYDYGFWGSNTPFKRRIRIERPTADSIRATVDVMWKEGGQIRKVTIQNLLYDWR